MAVCAVIFDYKTLISRSPVGAQSLRGLLARLADQGIGWVLFSTDPLSSTQAAAISGLQAPVAHIQQSDIPSGKRRGSPDWIDAVTDALELTRDELLYVGQTAMDWRTAINSGVLYIHALWSAPLPPDVTALASESPEDVADFVDDFLTGSSIWAHRLDAGNWTLRSLLPANAQLPSTSGAGRFTLQDVFTYDKTIDVGADEARDLLMITALTSAYLDGLIPANAFICVYPSSKKGNVSKQLADYLVKAAKLFHGYYRDDLLVRAADAPDTSLERVAAKREGRAANVSIATQATSVHLGAKYRGKLKTKTVVVFDDFTTHGTSLEWARILLEAADTSAIVMLTLGKYGTRHTHFELINPGRLNPYGINSFERDDFRESVQLPTADTTAESRTRAIFETIISRYSGQPH